MILFETGHAYYLNSTDANCTNLTSQVTSLPYLALGADLPCSYSGFLDSNANGTHHLFYWLFRTHDPNDTAPLVVWLNGGPGASSMFGNFLENGPLMIQENTTEVPNNTYDFLVGNNPQGSWADEAHLIFID